MRNPLNRTPPAPLDPDSLPELIPASIAATLLGILPNSLSRLGRRGAAPRAAHSAGSRSLYRRDEILAFAASRRGEQTLVQRLNARVLALETDIHELRKRLEALEGR